MWPSYGYRASNVGHDCRHVRQEQLNQAAGADAIGIAIGERWAATSTLLADRRGRASNIVSSCVGVRV